MNGRLVGPKTWDLIVGKFGTRLGQSTDSLGGLFCVCVLLNNMQIVFGVYEAGNGHGISVPQSGTDAWYEGCSRTTHCSFRDY